MPDTIFLIITICFILFICGSLYRYIKRGVTYFFNKMDIKKIRVISIAGIIIVFLPAIMFKTTWVLIIMHIIFISYIVDLFWFISKKLCRLKPGKVACGLYYSCSFALVVTIMIMSYGYWNMRHIIRTEYNVQSQKELNHGPYKIAMIADLHYGITLDFDELNEQIQRISQEKPDIVLLAGDIVDENTTLDQVKEVFPLLGKIYNKYGIYYVYGNHDKSAYSTAPNYSVGQLNDSIKGAGIKILEDEVVDINDDIYLIGRADYSTPSRKSIDELQTGINSERFMLVMDHQPVKYNELEAAGVDMVVSGHTHAGQIFPVGIISEAAGINEKNYGYDIRDNLNALVTSGIAGWGFPVKTEGHSEYVIINLE